jgi:hypothetical protein
MSTVIKQCTVNGFCICLELVFDGSSYYSVETYIKQSNNTCGYPIDKMRYPISDRKNALRTYNRYVKKYTMI